MPEASASRRTSGSLGGAPIFSSTSAEMSPAASASSSIRVPARSIGGFEPADVDRPWVRPGRRDEQHADLAGASGDGGEHVEAGLVGPVHVVDQEYERTGRGEPVDRGQSGRDVVAVGRSAHVRQELCDDGERPPMVAVVRRGGASGESVLVGQLVGEREQRCLADARLTDDVHTATRPVTERVEGGGDDPDLGGPAMQGAGHAARRYDVGRRPTWICGDALRIEPCSARATGVGSEVGPSFLCFGVAGADDGNVGGGLVDLA